MKKEVLYAYVKKGDIPLSKKFSKYTQQHSGRMRLSSRRFNFVLAFSEYSSMLLSSPTPRGCLLLGGSWGISSRCSELPTFSESAMAGLDIVIKRRMSGDERSLSIHAISVFDFLPLVVSTV